MSARFNRFRTRMARATATGAAASTLLAGCHLFDLTDDRTPTVKVAWHVSGTGGGIPVFDGTTAYFVDGKDSVVAIDAATGQIRWRAATGSVGNASQSSNCAMIADLIACGDSGIAAFHHANGSTAWRFDVPREQPGKFAFQVHAGTIYAGSFGRGTVYAVDGATGALRWTAAALANDPNGVNVPALAADDDIVVGAFVRGTKPETGGVIAIDAATGHVRWITNFPLAGPDSACAALSAALWQNEVLAATTDGKIYAVNRATGSIDFFFPGVGHQANIVGLTGPVGQDLRAIAVSGSTLFASSTGSWFIAYDLERRRELWRTVSTVGSAIGTPILPDGRAVYVIDGFGHLTAFSSAEPRVLWDFHDPGGSLLFGGVAVSNDRVFVAGTAGFWAIEK
jgi:outer membrane protein assembly factor BamB